MKSIFLHCILLSSLCGCMKGKKVDLIIHNALIYTANDMNEKHEAMAIKDGKIVEVGPERQILNKYRCDESLDMMQSIIYPPFTDCNVNIFQYLDKDQNKIHEHLSNIENELLQQGIDKIHIQNVSFDQLKLLLKQVNKYPSVLKYILFLKDEELNFKYIKNKKLRNNNQINIQGISISNVDEVSNSIVRAKANNLQIQLSDSIYPFIQADLKNQLLDYNSDHRWIVNTNTHHQDKILTEILMKNIFIVCSEKTKSKILIENQLYSFGSGKTKIYSFYKSLKRFKLNNKLNDENILKSITNWPSYLTYNEKNEGTIEKNKIANFVVFPQKLNFSNENNEIYITKLFHNGKEVYSTE